MSHCVKSLFKSLWILSCFGPYVEWTAVKVFTQVTKLLKLSFVENTLN